MQARGDFLFWERATDAHARQAGLLPVTASNGTGDNDTSLRSHRSTRRGWNSHEAVSCGRLMISQACGVRGKIARPTRTYKVTDCFVGPGGS